MALEIISNKGGNFSQLQINFANVSKNVIRICLLLFHKYPNSVFKRNQIEVRNYCFVECEKKY